MMDVISPQGCGLDVPTKTVAAWWLISTEGPEPVQEMRTFRTMPAALLALADWRQERGGPHGAMESPGVSWRPVSNVREGQGALLVVHAPHLQAGPGRHTDGQAAAGSAALLCHGLWRGRVIPATPQRQFRERTRYRSTLVQAHARALNRCQAVLEEANLQLASVVTDS